MENEAIILTLLSMDRNGGGRARGLFKGVRIEILCYRRVIFLHDMHSHPLQYLKEELSRIEESWAAARFDSLPHVVHILTSRDRDGEAQLLKEQSDVIEEVVDEVVHSYHSGFNKAIQNYSQILRLFSESTESIKVLKVDLAEAKRLLGARNKQLHQLWYRSVTLRHIISLLDQIEGIAKVPARIEKLVADKQFYAAIQLHVQSTLMLEREGLQTVGALQDVRSELTKLRGILFYKILEDLHDHLYNKGEYSAVALNYNERDDEVPTTTATAFAVSNSQPLSRRTRLLKVDNHFGGYGLGDGSYKPGSIDESSSFDGHDDDSEFHDEANSDGYTASIRANGDAKLISCQVPTWLSSASPDEFLEAIKKSDASVQVNQRLRPTVHEIITSKIKAHMELANSSRLDFSHTAQTANKAGHSIKALLENYHLPKKKHENGLSVTGALLAVSPVSSAMAPSGTAQAAAKQLVDSILDSLVRIFENHVIVGELLESKSAEHNDMNTPKSMPADMNWNPDSEASQITGGYSIGSSLTVLQSECQQLICEILRATPEAASADAAVQTARLASKNPTKEKRDGSKDGLTFAFRFTDTSLSLSNQGVDLVRQGWGRRGSNVLKEGYGSAAVLPEQGIYLAASLYRPVLQFTDKVASMLPTKYSQLGNDGLLSFVENFVKDHLLPTIFVDYRKGLQQAISSQAAFRPRAHVAATYTPSIEKGRPVLQGLLAVDLLAKEVLGWAHAMPKFAGDLVKFVQSLLERTYERCRTAYMEARHDIESLMRHDPASACLPEPHGQLKIDNNLGYADNVEVESEMSDLLLNLRPIKQDNLIRDDNKLILLASLSDSLELGKTPLGACDQSEDDDKQNTQRLSRASSAVPPRSLASFADEYRKLAIDCLKVLRIEMQLETIFHMQEMGSREYLDDQDAEEPDDFVISLTAQITHRDEEMAPFVAGVKRNYIFGGICSIAANITIKALSEMKSINLFGVQQICWNTIALEQALAAIPSIESDVVHQRLDRALLAFIVEHEHLFTGSEYANLLKVQVPGREIPPDALDRLSEKFLCGTLAPKDEGLPIAYMFYQNGHN
ncbi:Exocyst complex component Sec8, N-terminal [Dillenia turbinata]|uniref:Exocyst complex component Sec8 n=1 Tax=Dillenia turbinata TaxID=194707 RepID=A0AAN8ZGA4_9MAGN